MELIFLIDPLSDIFVSQFSGKNSLGLNYIYTLSTICIIGAIIIITGNRQFNS